MSDWIASQGYWLAVEPLPGYAPDTSMMSVPAPNNAHRSENVDGSANGYRSDPAALAALVGVAHELRSELAATSAAIDWQGTDTADNMRRIHEAGLNRIHVPRAYGGLATGRMNFAFATWIDLLVEICAGETSTGQNWGTSGLVTREIFEPETDLPESTRRQLAHEILNDGIRFVASNAEAGRPPFDMAVTARKVSGGVIVSGTKVFNTNSGGGGYANVGCMLVAGETRTQHHALTRLDAPGVRQHHDWDNMGQRATCSQTIDYEDVFVPDGWHYPQGIRPPALAAGLWALHGTLTLGAGIGALDAALAYLHSVKRTITPGAGTAASDPLIKLRVGASSTRLAAAWALLRQASAAIEAFDGTLQDVGPVFVDALRAKAACNQAGLDVSAELYELTGARSTANAYRMDRFWRNARTYSVHDATDIKLQWVGGWEIAGEAPPMLATAFL